jgi:methionyl-tRNA synthetase
LSEFPFGTDGNISIDAFDTRFNSDLANDLGNLLNRTVAMVNRYFQGQLPPVPSSSVELDAALRTASEAMAPAVERAVTGLEFSVALEAIRAVVSLANRYVDSTQPWALARTDRGRLTVVLAHVAETLRLLAIELRPFMPTSIARMLAQLGIADGQAGERRWGGGPPVARVAEQAMPLFPKIEAKPAGAATC